MKQKKDPIKILEDNSALLRSYGIIKIGLFGSILDSNKFNDSSDVDVYVEFNPKLLTLDNYFDVFDKLEDLFGAKIDLVTDDSLSPYLGPEILASVKYARLDS